MKKFLSLFLVLAMTLSLSATAYAYQDTSDVTFESDVSTPDVFNVIVPVEIPIYMSETGDIQVSQTLEILNKSTKSVYVENIQVNGNSDWAIRDFEVFDFKNSVANTHDLALSFRDSGTYDDGHIWVDYADWIIEKSGSLPILADAKLPLQTYAGRSSIATVIWTIDWADNMGEQPERPARPEIPEIPEETGFEIAILPGVNGSCDAESIMTDSDGRISNFPGVIPESGYMFDHWEDQDGNIIDENSVLNSGDQIRPVFRLDENQETPEIPEEPEQAGFEIAILPGVNGSCDVESIMTDSDGRISNFPGVIPEDGYVFDYCEDQAGNIIDENSILNPGDQIRPVFKLDESSEIPEDSEDLENQENPEQSENPETPEIPEQDEDKSVIVNILPGENGSVSAGSIMTGFDGRIIDFPSVTPDEGYMLDHWEDAAGNLVDSDTVFSTGAVIRPVFVLDLDTDLDAGVTTESDTDSTTVELDDYYD